MGKYPGVNLDTARNKTEAYLLFQFHKYKVIFCDYDLLSENDFELYSHIKESQDEIVELIVTGYGDTSTFKFGEYPTPQKTLSKPIDQHDLTTHLDKLLGAEDKSSQHEMDLSEENLKGVERILSDLQRNTNARCIVVSNPDGRVLIQQGETETISVDALATLVSGSIITLEEVGHIFNDPTVINLAFREGAKSDLYVMNIGQRLMLILIQDKSVISPKIGTVWFYARQAAIAIDEMIKGPGKGKSEQKFTGEDSNNIISELDKILDH